MHGGWFGHPRVFLISRYRLQLGNLVEMEYIGLLGQDTRFHGILDQNSKSSSVSIGLTCMWNTQISWQYEPHLISIGVYRMHTFLPRPIKTRDIIFLMLAADLSFLSLSGFNGVFPAK